MPRAERSYDLSAHERRLEWVDSDTPRDNAVRWCALRKCTNSTLADSTFAIKYFYVAAKAEIVNT